MDLYSFVTTGKSTQVIGRKTFLISGRGIYPVQDELPANVQKSILEMTCVLTKDGTTKITRIKLACKIKALDMLCRHLGMIQILKNNDCNLKRFTQW